MVGNHRLACGQRTTGLLRWGPGQGVREAPGGCPAGRPATRHTRGFSRISYVSITSSTLMSL
ncbi:hypothetical protein GCM10027203_10890 [Nonomuraea fastidiosa]